MNKLSDLCKNVSVMVRDGANLSWEKQDDWQKKANGYRIRLRYKGKQMSIDFWQGTGITHEPEAAGVLECLLSDATCGDESFEDFCSDMGYDEDSRRAERVYRHCKKINKSLKALLGDDYETFLYSDR
jgi:hypothetical protein